MGSRIGHLHAGFLFQAQQLIIQPVVLHVGHDGLVLRIIGVGRAVEQRGGLFKRDALNRQRAKARPGDLQTGSSKDHLLHKVTLLPDGGRGSAARCAV